jgi:hypothetical protein
MARANTSDELWVAVSSAGFITDETAGTPGNTTSDAAYSAGDSVLSVVSETNFSAGDVIRLATGNSMEIGIVETTGVGSITVESNIAFAHASGIAVVEQKRVDLGDISDDGVTRESSVERTEIRAATQAGTYATLVTNANARLGWNLLNHSEENVLFALGIDEALSARLHGAGTAVDPTVADLDPDNFNELTNIAVYFAGSLRDGSTIEVQGWNCDFDPNATISYLRGQAVSIPFAADVQHIRYLNPSQV